MSLPSRLRQSLAVGVLCLLSTAAEAAGPRIGFLSPGTPASSAVVLEGLRKGLREQGYVDGRNIVIEPRFANNRFDRLPGLARELIDMPVDVLVANVTQASIAAKEGTRTIPIVMLGVSDPVASGLVDSLSRPGGNVTGTSGMFSEAAGKRLQLLMQATSGSSQRVAVLWNPANRVFQAQMVEETVAAARSLGIQLRMFEAQDAESIESAFAAIAKERFSGLSVMPDPTLAAQGARIAALATRARLPSVSGNSAYADVGGLMTYGPSFPEMARGAGVYVARILKGAKPAELPVERPTKFELVINMKTARELGITVPRALRLQAERVIE